MSRKAKGSVRQKGGKWEARITLDGESISKLFATRAEGQGFLKVLGELHGKKRKAQPTLRTHGKRWLDARENGGHYAHVRKERSLLKVALEGWKWADRPLKRVQRKHVAAHIQEMADCGDYAQETVANRLRIIKGALEAAHTTGLLDANPAAGMRVPKMAQKSEDDWTWLRVDEIGDVLGLVHARDCGPERRALYAAAIFTGLRKSELFHLRWERVHLDGPRPRIEVRAPLKSKHAKRDVPLLPPAIFALREWRERGGVIHATGLVWPKADGGLHSDSFDAGWRDHPYKLKGKSKVRLGAKSRAGITRRARFHDLRHTCASHLAQGSWGVTLTLPEIKSWLGHSSIQVTQRYAHLCPDGLHGKAAQMAEEMRK